MGILSIIVLGFFAAGIVWKFIWRIVFISVIQDDFPHITYWDVNKFCKVLRGGNVCHILSEQSKLFGRRHVSDDVIVYTKIIKESW